mmetsp:Transcript_5943/g.13797  ORF Transcript_5943/g.13797 Transcript_5943/m.13797 type:complete len:205 (-) Transcript_5943:20-634(-)
MAWRPHTGWHGLASTVHEINRSSPRHAHSASECGKAMRLCGNLHAGTSVRTGNLRFSSEPEGRPSTRCPRMAPRWHWQPRHRRQCRRLQSRVDASAPRLCDRHPRARSVVGASVASTASKATMTASPPPPHHRPCLGPHPPRRRWRPRQSGVRPRARPDAPPPPPESNARARCSTPPRSPPRPQLRPRPQLHQHHRRHRRHHLN